MAHALGRAVTRRWDARALGSWVETIEGADAVVKLPDQRAVILRTSFVIGRDRGAGGGALSTLGLLVRLGLGGRVGSGKQGMSWIHETDLNRLFAQAISDESMSGVSIASSPSPVSQIEFMRTLVLEQSSQRIGRHGTDYASVIESDVPVVSSTGGSIRPRRRLRPWRPACCWGAPLFRSRSVPLLGKEVFKCS